jgi:hypothetical protein
VLDEAVDAAAAGASAEALAEIGEVFDRTGCDDFDIAFFGVADPAVEVEFAGFAMDEPAESYALDAALNEEVENHSSGYRQFFRWLADAQGAFRFRWKRRVRAIRELVRSL